MVEQNPERLDAVFHALADPTRRAMLRRLAEREESIGELAAPFAMTFAGASKHVKVLENAGLVRRTVRGRSHVVSLDPMRLAEAEAWLRYYERFWTGKLDTLEALLRAEDKEPRMSDRKMISLTVKRRFSSPVERVFDAWLDPQMARKWLFTTAESEVARCEIEPHVGGRFTIVDRREDGDIEHVGTYLMIERPTLLVFSFAVPKYSPLYDRVTVEIRPLDGGCELSLTNELDLENEEWRDQTIEGWTMILNSLARELGEQADKKEHDDAA